MTDALRGELLAELRLMPRGSPAQDLFRLAYSQARLIGVDRQCETPATPEVAREFALTWVRKHYPNFVPDETTADR